MKFHFAPVQGHTDAPYRHFHNLVYKSLSTSSDWLTYYTPFIRLEGDGLRKKDIKDFASPLNTGISIIPQIIFRDNDELLSLISLLKDKGATKIDLNMGCPFPLQTGHGRGAATVGNEILARQVRDAVTSNPDIIFSVKIRLGLNDPEEWKKLIPYLNETNLSHLTVHPRVARQQYGGDLNMDQFLQILDQSLNPVVFNGEIRRPNDVSSLLNVLTEPKESQEFQNYNRADKLAGLMIGRGMLCRPSLINEIAENKEWPKEQRIELMLRFHKLLYDYYSSELCGDAQIISKIQPFWEYAEDEIGRKAWKAIKKATNIAKYNSAVALIGD